MQEEISELSALALVLYSDLHKCKVNLSPTNSGFWDRARIRFFFTMVEGVSYRMRQLLIAGNFHAKFTLSYQELCVLNEIRLEVKENGRIHESVVFINYINGFRLTLEIFSRKYDLENYCKSAIDHKGWNDFCKSVDIRNRLTHPKSSRDLTITKAENKIIEHAENWYKSLLERMLNVSLKETVFKV